MTVLQNVRFSYANVWEPQKNLSGVLKYSSALMIQKSNKATLTTIEKAINEAIEVAIEKGKFTKAQIPQLRMPLRDGDEEVASGKRGPEYEGCFFLNANSGDPIGIVDSNAKPIFEQSDFYSGCHGHADVNFAGYNKGGGVGIGCYLNNVMKTEDDDRLDGRRKAEDVFAAYSAEPETEDGTADLE